MTPGAERVKLSNLSVEAENLRLATCLLALGEPASSGGWWFGLRSSLLLPSTREQATRTTRRSFSTLQDGLISKSGIGTTGFLPYDYTASTQTQICLQVESVVQSCLIDLTRNPWAHRWHAVCWGKELSLAGGSDAWCWWKPAGIIAM